VVGMSMEVEISISAQPGSTIVHVSIATNPFAKLEDVRLDVKVEVT